MPELICDIIAEKLNHGANIWNPYLRQIVGWALNQTWDGYGIFEIQCDSEDDLWVLPYWGEDEDGINVGCRSRIVRELIQIAEFYDLNERERGYLLSKIPSDPEKVGKKRRRPQPPELALVDKLRVTNRDGSYSYYDRAQKEELREFCRKNQLTLHESIKGEWIQIIP